MLGKADRGCAAGNLAGAMRFPGAFETGGNGVHGNTAQIFSRNPHKKSAKGVCGRVRRGIINIINHQTRRNCPRKKYVCSICGYVYDPEVGDPDNGIAPGTAFEDIPEDWVCPLCGAGKDVFEEE